jgi:type I restriction enzyme S subunit
MSTRNAIDPSTTSEYARYDSYRDTGVDWLGEIPTHWKTVKLKYCVSGLTSGGTPASTKDEYWAFDGDNKGIPWVSIGDMTRNHRVKDTEKSVTHQGLDAADLEILPAGTLLYSIYASLGKVAVLEVPAVTNQAILGIRLDGSSVERGYLSYWLQYMQRHVEILSSSNTQDNLSAERVRNMPVYLPTLDEQRAIAAYLDRETERIDALIDKKERLIDLLDEKRTALISHAVTKGLDDDVAMQDSGVEWLGEIPAGWETARLKFLADVQGGIAKGKTYDDDIETVDLPYLRVANVQDGYLNLDEISEIEVAVDDVERYALHPGDVLMNEGGDFDKLGRGTVWHGEIQPCLHQNHVFAVRPRTLESEWLALITQARYAKHFFILHSVQSTNLASISMTSLQGLPVVLPPKKERRRILEHVQQQTSHIDSLLDKVRDGIDRLEEYRTALISAAVTGQIDVREEVEGPDNLQ